MEHLDSHSDLVIIQTKEESNPTSMIKQVKNKIVKRLSLLRRDSLSQDLSAKDSEDDENSSALDRQFRLLRKHNQVENIDLYKQNPSGIQ